MAEVPNPMAFEEPPLFEMPSPFMPGEFGEPPTNYVNIDALQPLIKSKAIRVRQHPDEPLDIINYQPMHAHRQGLAEDPIIDHCRGLIYNRETGLVIARPFSRMTELHDYEELPEGDQTVFEKLDGSLGVQYMNSEGEWRMASRNNFTHRHAEFGNQALQEVQQQLERENHFFKFNPDHTYLWEMIFPEGQHVVDYGDQRGIVLLGIIETATGVELPLPDQGEVPFHVVRQFTGEHFHSAKSMRELDFPNAEGFVVRMDSGPRAGERFKVKFPSYEIVRKDQKGLLEQYLFNEMRQGRTVGDIMGKTPPSVRPLVHGYLARTEEKIRTAGGEALAALDAARKAEGVDDRLRQALSTGYNKIVGQLLLNGAVQRPESPRQAETRRSQQQNP